MIYIITGQTATGKTKRAIELAQKIDGEIINADARQIYKKLDIITGKDLELTTREFHLWNKDGYCDIGYYELKSSNNATTYNLQPTSPRVWLYDIVDPSVSFSAVEYAHIARQVIEDIISRGKTPIIVGGTYFYLQQLLYDTVQTHVEPNQTLREKLQNQPITVLQRMLSEKNLILFRSLNNSERNNPQRLIRKIEIIMSDSTITSKPEPFPYSFKIDGYYYESKSLLRDRIASRVAERIHNGAIEEGARLVKQGYDQLSPGLATIGYQQVLSYLKNEWSEKEMKDDWITKEVQYAKRQLSFMKRDENIVWHRV